MAKETRAKKNQDDYPENKQNSGLQIAPTAPQIFKQTKSRRVSTVKQIAQLPRITPKSDKERESG
jgi:hypothetical protein